MINLSDERCEIDSTDGDDPRDWQGIRQQLYAQMLGWA
jgi:hypothetical protein